MRPGSVVDYSTYPAVLPDSCGRLLVARDAAHRRMRATNGVESFSEVSTVPEWSLSG